MKIKDGYVVRDIANQKIAVPVGSRVNDLHGMIALNETGCFLWKLLETDQTVSSLTTALVENYNTYYDEANSAVIDFLDELKRENLLEE